MKHQLLIAIPYWTSDRNQAYDLCKLIAGMQQIPSEEAQFLLVARQDCMPDHTMSDILSRKFKVQFYKSESPLKGWPAGANGMFGRTICHVGNITEKFKAMFWMEPDCVPTRRDWIKILSDEWDKRQNGKFIVGFTHSVDGTKEGMHVNGNAIYDQQIARLIPEISSCDRTAWDWQHRAKMLRFAHHTNAITNRYKATNAKEEDFDDKIAVIHGYKDNSLLSIASSKFGIK